MKKKKLTTLLIGLFLLVGECIPLTSQAQHSVARKWNELLLEAIRGDFARPTVHARNLFHTAIALYDSWAVYDDISQTYLLGKTVDGYFCAFDGIETPSDLQAAREETMSYAAYRVLSSRFRFSPGYWESQTRFDSLFRALGYTSTFESADYAVDGPAALGNYIGDEIIRFGLQDGSNEAEDYSNTHYFPVNSPLAPDIPGNPFYRDPNRWQPLSLQVFIDQSGNLIPGRSAPFLNPEWGIVSPFALKEDDLTIYSRDGENEFWVYHDPGPPPYINVIEPDAMSEEFQWGFSLVSIWSSHLDPADGVMWDISPASIGNISEYPETFAEHRNFYNTLEGGDPSRGHSVNPHTGQPYPPQMVPRADYARVLAEFWADGPDSETPPGHWFTILNYVNDHPELEKRFRGKGPVMPELEWDVKAYFALGGAMHDAAISAWGIKGWYDYLRPVSAIRAMADRGQSTNPNFGSYDHAGIPLVQGLIELVTPEDSLSGEFDQHVGKIKVFAWRGPDYINDPETDFAGVGWILAENWWPYQRPTFVTPPFAGYVSGHSTYSRAAAEVLTMLTGDPFFPGGVGEFIAKKDEFLVFEEGPSVDVILQWATYRDASDQTSLSRIWGGIHPPADDIPGRLIGEKIGVDAFEQAEGYFVGRLGIDDFDSQVYPNPVTRGDEFYITLNIPIETPTTFEIEVLDIQGRKVLEQVEELDSGSYDVAIDLPTQAPGMYFVKVKSPVEVVHKVIVQ